MDKNSVKYGVLVMLESVMLKLFLIPCLIWCIKNNMYCIISEKVLVYKNTLHKYGRKDVANLLRGNCVFYHTNACINTLYITIS